MMEPHFKKLQSGRALEMMLGSYGIKTREIVTNEDLCRTVRDVFQVEGETINALFEGVSSLNRSRRRKLAKSYLLNLVPDGLDRAVVFSYTNWRGEQGSRLVTPAEIKFTSTAHHHERQWIMRGYDHHKKEFREFAMKDMGPMSHFKPVGAEVDA